jgi:hypothetical protein
MKEKGVPVKQRKYLLRHIDFMKRGLLTFEYLSRRTTLKPCRKLTIAQPQKGKSAAAKKDKK